MGGFSSDLLQIDSGGQFDAPSGYTNNDEIQLSGTDARITGGTLTNNGFIGGQGRINASLTNNGDIDVSNGTLIFGSQVINNGHIDVSGGTLRFDSQVINNASGYISGVGASTIRFDGGLDNSGDVLFSFASATVSGDIINNSGGLVSVAGNSTTTFIGDMVNNGMVWVGSGSHAVFGGATSGSGNFPGGGRFEFVDGFSPGNSSAEVSFGGDVVLGPSSTTLMELEGTETGEYDRLLVAGSLEVGGGLEVELLNGFTPTIDNVFQIFDAMDLSGTFSSVVLPDLLGNLGWDSSQLYTSGTLSVFPEPSTLGVMLVLLVGYKTAPRRRWSGTR